MLFGAHDVGLRMNDGRSTLTWMSRSSNLKPLLTPSLPLTARMFGTSSETTVTCASIGSTLIDARTTTVPRSNGPGERADDDRQAVLAALVTTGQEHLARQRQRRRTRTSSRPRRADLRGVATRAGVGIGLTAERHRGDVGQQARPASWWSPTAHAADHRRAGCEARTSQCSPAAVLVDPADTAGANPPRSQP